MKTEYQEMDFAEFNALLPYFVRALHFNVSPNMIFIYAEKLDKGQWQIGVIFEEKPSQSEINLVVHVTGLLDCDAEFKNTKYKIGVWDGEYFTDVNYPKTFLLYARADKDDWE